MIDLAAKLLGFGGADGQHHEARILAVKIHGVDGHGTPMSGERAGQALPVGARVIEGDGRVIHVANGVDIGAIGDENGLRLAGLALVDAQEAGARGMDICLHTVGGEVAENGVGRKGAVIADLLGELGGIGGERLEPGGEAGVFRARGLDFLLHERGAIRGRLAFRLGELQATGEALLFGLGEQVAAGEQVELTAQGGGQVGLLLLGGLGGGELLLFGAGLFGGGLQLAVQVIGTGLRGGDLLLEAGLLLLQPGVFLLGAREHGLLFAGIFAFGIQLLLQLFVAALLFLERLFHHGVEVFAGFHHGIGGDIHAGGALGIVIGDMIHVR